MSKITEIIVKITNATAVSAKSGPLTSGMVGVPVSFIFDDAWDGLFITAVFQGSGVVRDMLLDDTRRCIVPHEVLAAPNSNLHIGAEGRDAAGELVIPSTMAYVGYITTGADPSGDESTDPYNPVWAQLRAEIEQLKQNGSGGLPAVTEADNGKIAKVVDGKWTAAELPVYDGTYSVTPSATEDQILKTGQTYMDADITIEKIPYSEVLNNSGGTTVNIGG